MAATNTPATQDLSEGQIIQGKFRLVRLLGQGGMGSVWLADHLTLNVEVALKFIDTQLVSNVDIASRFSQEAHAAAKIKSAHVVSIQDHGTDEAGRPFIAMERLQGEELAVRLEREKALPIADVVKIVGQAAKGLAKAHAAGFVHRDLKPENIFLCEDEDGFLVKLLDFGIAKADSPVGGMSHKTGTGQLIGTPAFMSPEQARGTGQIDSRSDLYSLAVVAYRCLTGRLPFDAPGLGELIIAISMTPPPPPSSLRRDLTPAIDAWFERAMAKSRDDRFASAREMADAFTVACDPTTSAPTSLAVSTARPSLPTKTAVMAQPSGRRQVSLDEALADTQQGSTEVDLSVAAATDPPAVKPKASRSGAVIALVAAVMVAGVVGVMLSKRGDAAVSEREAAASTKREASAAPVASAAKGKPTSATGEASASGPAAATAAPTVTASASAPAATTAAPTSSESGARPRGGTRPGSPRPEGKPGDTRTGESRPGSGAGSPAPTGTRDYGL